MLVPLYRIILSGLCGPAVTQSLSQALETTDVEETAQRTPHVESIIGGRLSTLVPDGTCAGHAQNGDDVTTCRGLRLAVRVISDWF